MGINSTLDTRSNVSRFKDGQRTVLAIRASVPVEVTHPAYPKIHTYTHPY